MSDNDEVLDQMFPSNKYHIGYLSFDPTTSEIIVNTNQLKQVVDILGEKGIEVLDTYNKSIEVPSHIEGLYGKNGEKLTHIKINPEDLYKEVSMNKKVKLSKIKKRIKKIVILSKNYK